MIFKPLFCTKVPIIGIFLFWVLTNVFFCFLLQFSNKNKHDLPALNVVYAIKIYIINFDRKN